ncbi:MAG: hemolysin family protein [Verrucomicrobiota bacterium]|nr:hemolysin family protein [Verrucomicrobiota bacterium]
MRVALVVPVGDATMRGAEFMKQVGFEIIILFLLLVANGVFAMAEIAVVSARKARLRRLAEQGNGKARAALDLAESPNRFLATVQVGITLVGIFAGALGGATLAAKLAQPIGQIPAVAAYADKIAFGIVVALITYFSLVLGELVPKRLGLSNPEGIAMAFAKPMNWLSRLASPLVTFLSVSTEGLLRALGFKPEKGEVISAEEVQVLMQEGVRAGAFNKAESDIIHSALELDQLPVREIMTPRPKVIWVNEDDSHEQIWHKIVVSNHSYFPVYRENRDNTVGIVSVKAIYANLAANVGVNLKDLMVPPLVVPETQTVIQLVETFKQSGKHIALVTDEFGNIVGLVTLNDVMEAIVGEFPSQGARARPEAKKREDGSWLIDAMIDLEAVEKALPGFKFGDEAYTEYQTLAGFVVKFLGRVPKEGETFEVQGYLFEVLDMDRHRVDKILVMSSKTITGQSKTQ